MYYYPDYVGIEREASREGGVDESEARATPQEVIETEERNKTGYDLGERHRLDEVSDNFNTPPSGSPAGDVKCKTAYQMVPEVDPQHHHQQQLKGRNKDDVAV